jgi:hypothetical protein
MALFGELPYNEYVPQYVGAPINELFQASQILQQRGEQTREGYDKVADDLNQLQSLSVDEPYKQHVAQQVQKRIEDAAKRGDYQNMQREMRALSRDYIKQTAPVQQNLNQYNELIKKIDESEHSDSHKKFLKSTLSGYKGIQFDPETGTVSNTLSEHQFNTRNSAASFAEFVDKEERLKALSSDFGHVVQEFGLTPTGVDEFGLPMFQSRQKVKQRTAENILSWGLNAIGNDQKFIDYLVLELEAEGFDPSDVSDKYGSESKPMSKLQEKMIDSVQSSVHRLGLKEITFKDIVNPEYKFARKREEELQGNQWRIPVEIPIESEYKNLSDINKFEEAFRQYDTDVEQIQNNLDVAESKYKRKIANEYDEDGKVVKVLRYIDEEGVDRTSEVKDYREKLDAVKKAKENLEAKLDFVSKQTGIPIQEIKQAFLPGPSFQATDPNKAGQGAVGYGLSKPNYYALTEKQKDNRNLINLKLKELSKGSINEIRMLSTSTAPTLNKTFNDYYNKTVKNSNTALLEVRDFKTGNVLNEGSTDEKAKIKEAEFTGTVIHPIYGLQAVYSTKSDKGSSDSDFVMINVPEEHLETLKRENKIDSVYFALDNQIGAHGGVSNIKIPITKTREFNAVVTFATETEKAQNKKPIEVRIGNVAKTFDNRGEALTYMSAAYEGFYKQSTKK